MKYSPKKKNKIMRCSASAITTQIPSKEGDKQLGDVVYQRPPINKIS